MMDRIAINNQIVVMRHAVRKARVAVASKLIKEIKLLNARQHGNENVIEKCKRKANKLIKEMKLLKKLKDDDISKFAITNTRDIQEVLADSSVGIKTRIMIRLASHKSLDARVKRFRETFPDYQMYFDSEKKVKGKKNKNSSANGVKQPDQTEKTITDATSVTVLNNVTQSRSDCDLTNLIRQDEMVLDAEVSRPTIPEIVSREKKKKKMVELSPKYLPLVTADLKPNEFPTVKIVSKLATVKRFHVANNVMENIGKVEPIVNDTESQEDIEQSDGEIDVFLTTRNINNYSRTAVPLANSLNDVDHDMNSSRYHHSSRDSFTNVDNKSKRYDKFARNGVDTKSKFPSFTVKRLNNNHSKRSRINNIENATTSQMDRNSKMSNGDLHPSWAARRKQQDILKQGFQGKKIVFDNESSL